jgi:D-glycero-D-manno-heptose 1,7-bisphosphate phosphatase
MGRTTVFLDRDGVIIENRSDYVKTWDEVRFLPGAFEALRDLNRAGHTVVVVTNQSAVGRGIISLKQAAKLNRRLAAEVQAHGGRIDAWYMCWHHPEDGCECRKPAPGLLLRAQAELGLNLKRAHLIGDAISDIEAARAAGVRATLVLTGRGLEQADRLPKLGSLECEVAADLHAAVQHTSWLGSDIRHSRFV